MHSRANWLASVLKAGPQRAGEDLPSSPWTRSDGKPSLLVIRMSQWVVQGFDSLNHHNALLVPSHNWLAVPCECALTQAQAHHPASDGPPNAWAGYGDEAEFSFDDFDYFPSTSLPMDDGIVLPPNQAPPVSGMRLITINALRPRTYLYMPRLPWEVRRGAGFQYG